MSPISSKKADIHQLIRNGCTINRDKRLAAPRGKRMDDLCDQPFPCPCLALNQDRDIHGGNLFDDPVYSIKFSPQNIGRDSHF